MEEEENQEKIPGYVYGYLETLTAHLPEGNEVEIEIIFRKKRRSIPTTRTGDIFIINRKIRLPINIKIQKHEDKMENKTLQFKMYRVLQEGDRRQFGSFRINLDKYYHISKMEIETDEILAKMKRKPIFRFSLGIYFKTEEVPKELTTFSITKSQEIKENQEEKEEEENHLLELIEKPIEEGNQEENNYEENIKQEVISILSQTSEDPEIEEILFQHFYDITTSSIGRPGYLLGEEILKKGIFQRGEYEINKIFTILQDICYSNQTEENSLYFCISIITFYQRLYNKIDNNILKRIENLCQESIEIYSNYIVNKIKELFLEMFKIQPKTQEFQRIILSIKKIKNEYKFPSLQFLWECIICNFDCLLSNLILTENRFNTFSEILKANSLISILSQQIQEEFPRFQQVLLTVLAHETILNDFNKAEELVPLVPATFIYFLYCLIRPDENFREEINYEKIESFAKAKNIELNNNISDNIMFKPPKFSIPDHFADLMFE